MLQEVLAYLFWLLRAGETCRSLAICGAPAILMDHRFCFQLLKIEHVSWSWSELNFLHLHYRKTLFLRR
jgi:hypothetical protein